VIFSVPCLQWHTAVSTVWFLSLSFLLLMLVHGEKYIEVSIKNVRTKSQKIYPCPQNVRSGSTPLSPPCSCGHTTNFKKSEAFCTKKCGRPHLKTSPLVCKRSALDKPPLDCGPLLWTVSNIIYRYP